MPDFILQELPPPIDLETKVIMRQATQAHRYLAELKGVSKTIPNQTILINTLPLLEAKDSSAIENIITTHDELYKDDLFGDFLQNAAAKEVRDYSAALRQGFETVKQSGLLTNNLILEMHKLIEHNSAGFRKLPGTSLMNDRTREIVYVPPQNADDVARLMSNLEKFINDDDLYPLDQLVKMAVVHYQFESIHPFYDGNGRSGRIINILYLVQKGLLDIPVLYLSRYIIRTKPDYYRLLQAVRDNGSWEEWVLYMLRGVEETAKNTIVLVNSIRGLMQDYKVRIRRDFRFYSQDLLNNLFSHPYTKIEFLERDLRVSRKTAAKYLEELCKAGLLTKEKVGKFNFYINMPLFKLFLEG